MSVYPQNVLRALISKQEIKRNQSVEEFIDSQKRKYKVKLDDAQEEQAETKPLLMLKAACFGPTEDPRAPFKYLRDQLCLTLSNAAEGNSPGDKGGPPPPDRSLYKQEVDCNGKLIPFISRYWAVKGATLELDA